MALPDKLWDMYSNRLQPIKDFYFNYNEYHEKYNYGRMYYTKEGCRVISSDMRKKCENFELFTIQLCNFFDMPYISECMLKLKEIEDTKKDTGKDLNYVYQYQTCISELGLPKEKEKEYWNNLYCNNNFLHIDLLNVAKPTTEGDMDLFAKLNDYWGKNIGSLEKYFKLENRFKELTKGEELTPYIEESFRNLCLDELALREAREVKADQSEIKKIKDRIESTASKLGIDKFVSNKFKSTQEQLIEDWAYITENVEPLDWEDENLKDRLGIDKDYDNIMRSLGNKILNTKDYPNITLDDIKSSTKRHK